MKKIVISLLAIFTIVIFGQAFTLNELMNVTKPAGVVAQPYLVRTVLVPTNFSEFSSFEIGLEGHLELLGLNFSVGTTFNYPDLEFNRPVYLGAGITLGGLFASMSSKAPNFEFLSDLSKYDTPTIAFGIASSRKTQFLVSSWSRVEISYENKNILKKEDGKFVLNSEVDWLDAQTTLKVEGCDVGYFAFRLTVFNIREAMNGNFKANWELALPFSALYIYTGQPYGSEWFIGLGIAYPSFNALGRYNLQTGQIDWFVSAQM
ncbi:hypothetical protein MNL76_01570 [Fervidobacterium riparium]|nr:hypothetical protein IB67_08335 [Fervidobacterium riparium]